MSNFLRNLEQVQQEIKDLLRKKTKLKKKQQKNQLTDEEEIDL
jgi:hypothetical protein